LGPLREQGGRGGGSGRESSNKGKKKKKGEKKAANSSLQLGQTCDSASPVAEYSSIIREKGAKESEGDNRSRFGRERKGNGQRES